MPATNDYLQSLARPSVSTQPGGAASLGMDAPSPSPSAGASGPTSAVVSVFPWWMFKSESSQAWYQANLNFALAANTSNLVVTNFSFQCPPSCKLVLKMFEIQVTSPTTAITVFCTLLRNGQPINGWNNVRFNPSNAATLLLPFNDVNEILQENETLTASFTNQNIATAWTVGIVAAGWYTLLSEITRLSGGVRY